MRARLGDHERRCLELEPAVTAQRRTRQLVHISLREQFEEVERVEERDRADSETQRAQRFRFTRALMLRVIALSVPLEM